MIKRTIGICHHWDDHEIISGYKLKLQNTLYLNMILLVNTPLKLIICDTITNGTKIQYSITTDYPGWLRSFYIHPLRANHYCMRFNHFHWLINKIKILWIESAIIHCLHDFVHKQDSQLNSLLLITVWRVVIEV